MDDISKYFTVKEVAKRLDVTEDWVRDLIQSKQFKAVKIGKWRVDPEELKKFIQARTNIK
ncbi:MAG: helix-turn-helix domain-containing protein [Syntrophales bacterium]|jgi:excisionase family DNA binding protein|nr:helix-turn-helix domain-containing protein [Syntrophales bacterium]